MAEPNDAEIMLYLQASIANFKTWIKLVQWLNINRTIGTIRRYPLLPAQESLQWPQPRRRWQLGFLILSKTIGNMHRNINNKRLIMPPTSWRWWWWCRRSWRRSFFQGTTTSAYLSLIPPKQHVCRKIWRFHWIPRNQNFLWRLNIQLQIIEVIVTTRALSLWCYWASTERTSRMRLEPHVNTIMMESMVAFRQQPGLLSLYNIR